MWEYICFQDIHLSTPKPSCAEAS